MRSEIVVLAALVTSAALADDAPKRLSAGDLSVQTHKWEGKKIQTMAHCFYADVSDYRCAVGMASDVFVRIDFTTIEPDDQKKIVEDQCDTVEKMDSPRCNFQVIFVYDKNDWEEKADGSTTILIEPADGLGTLAKAGR